MSVSFCLARANRPGLHTDRQAHLQGSQFLLSSVPDRQLIADLQHNDDLDAGTSSSTAAGGVTAQLELVAEGYRLYLGETCVFYFTLSNQGGTPVSDITIKVECAAEGGSKGVLYDNGTSPLPRLPASGRHDVIVTTDIKEQGQVELVASAVFTDHMGERKYHVQFFKLFSASPLSVRTRMRCLPHVQQRSSSRRTSSSRTSSSSSSDQQQPPSGVSAAAAAAAPPGTRCFLEVSVENSTALPLVLHAVRLLTPAGITAQQLTLCEPQQQQQQHLRKSQLACRDSNSSSGGGGMQDHDSSSSSSGNDTQLLHDIADAPSVHQQQQQQQQQQHKGLLNSLGQLQLTQQQQQQDSRLGPLLQGQTEPLIVVPPAGSHNYLWQVDHQHLPAKSAAAGAAAAAPAGDAAAGPGTPTSSSSGSSVGRLELHWRNYEGKTGRLLTQPLSTLAAGWHRDVLMQLTQLQPAAAAAAAAKMQHSALDQALPAAAKQHQHQQQHFAEYLAAGEPVVATFTLTAAASVHQHASGPLLVLYSELPLAAPSTAAAAAAGVSQQADPTSSMQRRQSIAGPATPLGPSSSSSSGSSSVLHPDVAVQGPRIQRLPRLLPGQSASVSFVLLPLRRGWVRLPNFMVVSEVDQRLLDSVRDVQVLVV